MARPDDYITLVRNANKAVWDGINTLKGFQAEWVSMDYASTLPDGTGANEGYTRAEVDAVVNTTTNALVALLAEGHGTNLANLL